MTSDIIMAFDFGTKNIGIAIGQLITCTAQPLTICKVKNGIPDWSHIKYLLHVWKPKTAVIGLPLNMDGSEQIITTQARKLANQLHHRFGIKIILHDERLTTIEAKMYLFDKGGYRNLTKKNINTVSAVLILESCLQYKRNLMY